MKTGVADVPLHYGHCPKWLFPRMVRLSKAISEIIIMEYGVDEFIQRLSNPFFFQSLGCVVGFDWHSSGLTTTLTGALKEAIEPERYGIAVLGGKGRASRNTINEIDELAETFPFSTSDIENLKKASRLSAKVDNTALQDGFQLYHHCFIVTEKAKWCVVQQGMDTESRYARRYHWISENVRSFVEEPQEAIVCDVRKKSLNMVANESGDARKTSVDIIKDNPNHLRKYFSNTLFDYLGMPKEHKIDVKNYEQLLKRFNMAYEQQPRNYEQLLGIKGMGPKTVRALALLGKLIFGAEPSWEDPVEFSWAHGGKDGFPYNVNRGMYDKSVDILNNAIQNAKIGNKEKMHAIKRLREFV